MPFFSKWSLRTQLVFLVAISIFPALGIILYSGFEQRNLKAEEMQRSSFNMMQAISSQQQVITESSRQLLVTLSGIPEVQRMDAQACNALFRRLLPENPVYVNIFLLTNRGILLSSAVPSKYKDFSDRKYFRDALSSRVFSTGEYLVARITSSPVFTLSYPVLDEQGKLSGVLAVALDLRRYESIIADTKLPEKSVIVLSDHKGVRVYRYPEGDKYIGLQLPPELMKPMTEGPDEGTFVEKGVDDVRRMYAYKKFRLFKNSPPYLYLRLGIPEENAVAEAWSITKRNLVILAAVFVFALVLAWYLGSYMIANPLNRLVVVANRFRHGERDVVTELPYTDNELGRLAEAFDEMSMELNTRHDEQKKTMEMLRESEEKLRKERDKLDLILKTAQDGFWMVNASTGRLIEVNEVSCSMLGYTHEELLNRGLIDIEAKLLPEEIDRQMQNIKNVGIAAFETRHRTKSGKLIDVEVKVNYLPSSDQCFSFIRDITERKRAEEALWQSEQKFRNLFNNSEVGMFRTKLTGSEVLDSNDKYLSILGMTREEFIGKPSVIVWDDPKEREEMVKTLKAQHYVNDLEFRLRNKAGELRNCITSLRLYPENGIIEGSIIDITDLKRAEEALRAAGRRLDEIIEHLPDATFVIDSDRKVIAWNRAIEQMTGVPKEEMIGKGNYEYAIPFYGERRPIIIDLAFLPDEEFEKRKYDTVGRSADTLYGEVYVPMTYGGKGAYLSASASRLRDIEGKVIGAIESIRDVTEQNRAEGALAESELFNRGLVENLPDYIIVYGTDGKILYVNPATEMALGYNAKEVVGTSVLSHIAEEQRDEVISSMKVRQEGRETPAYEIDIVAQDGHRIPVIVKGTPIRYHDSPAFLILLIDITGRKQAEAALKESEDLFRVSMERAPDGVYMNDLEGNFLYGNRKAEEIIGYSREELIGRNYLDLNITEGSLNKAVELLNSEGESTGPYELELIRKDGRHIMIEINATVVKQRGQTNILGFVRDITERNRAEEERRSLEERLNRAGKMEALGQLAGGVAHDLNNVLGVLSGYSELLLMEIPEGSRSRGHVEKILQSTGKGAAIIDDLLTLARRGVTVSDVINLNSVVSGFLQTPIFEKIKDYHPRVTIRTECDKNLLNIKGSPLHLEKTLMNLVSNAAESISGKGEVTIRTESRYLDKAISGYDEVKEGEYAVLTVSDTGMGIPAENREKIFEPFYTKKTMSRSGTGLGLAIVWGTVKDHNGYIDVQTEVEKGTTFTLYFPVTREELIAPQQKVPITEYMGKGESVLVVDDIAEQREIATRLLTQLGYEVHVVSSGEEAVGYLKENKADILVLDMIMEPGIDGLETYQRILEIHPKQKAVIVSGFSETDRVKEARKLGAGAYVKKPYVIEKIGVAIRDELNR